MMSPEADRVVRCFTRSSWASRSGEWPSQAPRCPRIRRRAQPEHCAPSDPTRIDSKVSTAMKLLRYGPAGQEQPGILDAQGTIRALSSHLPDIGPEQLSPRALKALSRIDLSTLPAVSGNPRLGLPCVGTRKFIAIGLNYADHAAESNLPIRPNRSSSPRRSAVCRDRTTTS